MVPGPARLRPDGSAADPGTAPADGTGSAGDGPAGGAARGALPAAAAPAVLT